MLRIAALAISAVQIETRGSCHLTAEMVEKAFGDLAGGLELLVIENVGNLICTVAYDLGEDCRLVVLSTAEGEDKPLKYPAAFVSAHVLVVTKIDLEPYVDSRAAVMVSNALRSNPRLRVFTTSAKTGDGIGPLIEFISEKLLHGKEA